jgi:glutamine amidotransferase
MIDSDCGIVSAIKYKNIYGCQFHPEKSHKDGLKILEEFSKVKKIA